MKRFLILINGKNICSYNSKKIAIEKFWEKAHQLKEQSEIILWDNDNENSLYELSTNEL